MYLDRMCWQTVGCMHRACWVYLRGLSSSGESVIFLVPLASIRQRWRGSRVAGMPDVSGREEWEWNWVTGGADGAAHQRPMSSAEMNGVMPPLCWWVCEITAVLQCFPVTETWHSLFIRPQVCRDVDSSWLMSLFWWLATWHDKINQLRLDLDLGVKDSTRDMMTWLTCLCSSWIDLLPGCQYFTL